MKRFILMALFIGIDSWAFAASQPASQKVLAVAQASIVNYGLIRIQDLGGAFGKALGQNQICGLAGQAFTGFQVLTAAGVSESELANLLKGLLQSGLTVDQIRSHLNVDIAECTR